MPNDALLSLLIFIATVASLIKFQQHTTRVFGCMLLTLIATNQINTEQMLESLTNPGLVALILLIICAIVLEKTALLRLLASRLLVKSFDQSWFRLFVTTVFSSAVLNNTAIVATLLAPVRNNPHHPASKLLIPLSYSAILGGTLTLVGTSTNLIVNSLYISTRGESLGFFQFSLVGLCIVFFCGLVLFAFRHRLPNLSVKGEPPSRYFIECKVLPTSKLVGKTIEENGLRHLESLFLAEIIRKGRLMSPVTPDETIQSGDNLVFSGDVNKVMQLQQFDGLELYAKKSGLLETNLVEVVVRPESHLVGQTLKNTGFRALFNAAVVAIKRDARQISGKLGTITITSGDCLVLAVGSDFYSRRNVAKNFIIVSAMKPDTHLPGPKGWLVMGGFFLAIIASAMGMIDLVKALSLLTGMLILTRCIDVNEIVRRLPIDIWLIVSSALMLATAFDNSGLTTVLSRLAAEYLATLPVGLVLVALFLLAWLLTEAVTNNAAAALTFPLALSLADGLGHHPLPFIMIIAYGASACFLSPYGYHTNLMVYNAGGYTFGHFFKLGLPVALIYGTVVLITVPLFFKL